MLSLPGAFSKIEALDRVRILCGVGVTWLVKEDGVQYRLRLGAGANGAGSNSAGSNGAGSNGAGANSTGANGAGANGGEVKDAGSVWYGLLLGAGVKGAEAKGTGAMRYGLRLGTGVRYDGKFVDGVLRCLDRRNALYSANSLLVRMKVPLLLLLLFVFDDNIDLEK